MFQTCSQNVEDEQDLLLSTALRTQEVAVIFDWLEKQYSDLFGRGKGKSYKASKDDVWEQLVEAVNAVFKGRNKQTRESIYTKIDNMKNQGDLKN